MVLHEPPVGISQNIASNGGTQAANYGTPLGCKIDLRPVFRGFDEYVSSPATLCTTVGGKKLPKKFAYTP